VSASGALAQSGINAQQTDQQYRIYNGIRSGSLTLGEAARLESGQARIDDYEQRARADGRLSSFERQRLDSMLDRQSSAIQQEKHDGRQMYNGNCNAYGWNHGQPSSWSHPMGIEGRDNSNQQRIYNGVQNGSLTQREFGKLAGQQAEIDYYQARARSDGRVSAYERSRIDSMQDRQSGQISAQRHDGNRR
jgi:hypothetical protein